LLCPRLVIKTKYRNNIMINYGTHFECGCGVQTPFICIVVYSIEVRKGEGVEEERAADVYICAML
jgi:hypothetical protein